jgi:hypothetical protein
VQTQIEQNQIEKRLSPEKRELKRLVCRNNLWMAFTSRISFALPTQTRLFVTFTPFNFRENSSLLDFLLKAP